MAISLTHAFVSGKADPPDTSLVKPSNWNAQHTLTMATGKLVGRTTASTGAAEEISVGGALTFSALTLSLPADAVTNTYLANMATQTFKGRTTASTGDPEDLTVTQATAMLNAFTTSLKGLAPASGGGTTNFLRADGSWAAPPSAAGVTYATSAEVNAFSSTTTSLSPGNVFAAIAETTLVPSSNTITPDLTAFTNGAYTLTTGQALTLANPSAVVAGKQHRIRLQQPASGSVGTITFGSNYKKAAADGAALTASLNAVDYIYLDVRSSTEILYSFKRQVA